MVRQLKEWFDNSIKHNSMKHMNAMKHKDTDEVIMPQKEKTMRAIKGCSLAHDTNEKSCTCFHHKHHNKTITKTIELNTLHSSDFVWILLKCQRNSITTT